MKKFFLTTIIFISTANFLSAQTGWQILTTNTTLDLQELQCLGPDTIFIYGDNGILLKSFNDGNSFTTLNNGTASYMAGFFLDADTGFASTGSGNIIRSTNGGNNWGVTGGCTCLIDAICFSNKQIGLYGSLSGVHRSDDGGLSWSTSTVLPIVPHKISSLNDSVFVTTYHKSFYKSTDYGMSFISDTILYNSNYYLSGMSFINDSIGFVSSADGKLFKTVDQGNSWSLVSDLGFSIADIVFSDEQNGCLVTGNLQNEIRKTSSGGLFWSLDYTSTDLIEEIDFDGLSFYACGQNGMALRKNFLMNYSSEISIDQAIKIYPNPTEDILFINGLNGKEKIALYNSIGDLLIADFNFKQNQLNISSLHEGFYFLQITDAEKASSFVFEKL